MPGVTPTIRVCSVAVVLVVLIRPAALHAAIPEYQIVRLLSYETSCRPRELSSEDMDDSGTRFHAVCQNITSYPDGIELHCPDALDPYKCLIKTEPRRFEAMNSLQNQVDSGTKASHK
ncbi:MAG: hypothetical protein AAGI88_10000 [Pseudomonadota bacterium]